VVLIMDSDEKIIKDMLHDDAWHYEENVLCCKHCGCLDVQQRAETQYHNHSPMGLCLDEVWECSECGKYTQVIWRLSELHALDRVK